MTKATVASTLALLLLLGAGPALAQGKDSVPPKAPEQAAPDKPATPDNPKAADSLSHDLSRSGGVIHPPPTGDHSEIEPPRTGSSSMPVIPPPGTPGGNDKLQPK